MRAAIFLEMLFWDGLRMDHGIISCCDFMFTAGRVSDFGMERAEVLLLGDIDYRQHSQHQLL